jgi:predicted TIM-barrel fold metal-dependent hydrolase
MAGLCGEFPQVVGLATVFPGEPGTLEILTEAAALGLRGVKLHCHVQCLGPDDDRLHATYAFCADRDWPVVIHAGLEPRSDAYRCDPTAFCGAGRIARVLREFPTLRLCVPHLGSDEFDSYQRMIQEHDNLWLDTAMMAAGYFPTPVPARLVDLRPDRVMYGTDFPNLPYAWDRELRRLGSSHAPATLDWVLHRTARQFFGIPSDGPSKNQGPARPATGRSSPAGS